MTTWLLVAVGSAVGGAARYWINGLVARRAGETFPWGTFVVNVSGALLIGAATAMVLVFDQLGETAQAVLIVGLCGSYTTVSSFSLQTLTLAREGEFGKAVWNVLLSLSACLAGVWLGLGIAGWLPGASA